MDGWGFAAVGAFVAAGFGVDYVWFLRHNLLPKGDIGMRVKKAYAFAVDFEEEEDGSWSVDIPAVPVCAAWGFTKAEALEALQDLAQMYFEVLMEYNDPLPDGIEVYEIICGGEVVAKPEMVTVEI